MSSESATSASTHFTPTAFRADGRNPSALRPALRPLVAWSRLIRASAMAAGSLEVVGHAYPHSADSEFDRVDRTVLRTQANARDDGTLNRISSALNRIVRALNRIVRTLKRIICALNRIIRTGAWTAGLLREGPG